MTDYKNRITEYKEVDPTTITKNPNNFRTHPASQKAMMTEIFQTIGWINAVIVNVNTGNLIDGEMRLDEALEKNEATIPVIYVNLTEEEELEALLTHDAVGTFAKNQREKLDGLLKNKGDRTEHINDLATNIARKNRIDYGDYIQKDKMERGFDNEDGLVDNIPIEDGQMWEISSSDGTRVHRLMVGDSFDIDAVNALTNSVTGALFFADPPYGVDYKANRFDNNKAERLEDVEGDDLKGEELRSYIEALLNIWMKRCSGGAAFYLCAAQKEEGFMVYHGMKDAGINVSSQIIWVKDEPVLSQSDYHWQHEILWYGFTPGNHAWHGGKSQIDNNTVWNIPRVNIRKYLHPNQKPTDLLTQPIRNHTRKGEYILDPFCGCGTSIIAAEEMGRICCAMEKDRNYAAITLQRCKNNGMEIKQV